MALLADYHLGLPQLPLVDVTAAIPEATLRLDVGQPNQGGPPPFVVTATGTDVERLEDAFEETAFVSEYALVAITDMERRYRIVPAFTMLEQLGDAVDQPSRLERLSANESVVREITVTPEGWRQIRWFADRDAFEEYCTFWRENAPTFSLHRLSKPGAGLEDPAALTDRQRKALLTATEMGYFDVPRGATLADVAAELEITASSLSERLRRGQCRLVEERFRPP